MFDIQPNSLLLNKIIVFVIFLNKLIDGNHHHNNPHRYQIGWPKEVYKQQYQITNSHNIAKRVDLESCIGRFDVKLDMIIRTEESRAMGATFLDHADLGSREECLRLCCETTDCDVFVFEEKNDGTCFLFHCGPAQNFRCKFTHHANYTSAVLTQIKKIETPMSPPQLQAPVVIQQQQRNLLPTQTLQQQQQLQLQQPDLQPQSLPQSPSQVQLQPQPQPPQLSSSNYAGVSSGSSSISSTSYQTQQQQSFSQHEMELSNLKEKSPAHSDLVTTTLIPPLGIRIAEQVSTIKPTLGMLSTSCSRFQFACHSGECIAVYNACDGIPQCLDGSDEGLECPSNIVITPKTKITETILPAGNINNMVISNNGFPIPKEQIIPQNRPGTLYGSSSSSISSGTMINQPQQQQQQHNNREDPMTSPEWPSQMQNIDNNNQQYNINSGRDSHIFNHKGGLQIPSLSNNINNNNNFPNNNNNNNIGQQYLANNVYRLSPHEPYVPSEYRLPTNQWQWSQQQQQQQQLQAAQQQQQSLQHPIVPLIQREHTIPRIGELPAIDMSQSQSILQQQQLINQNNKEQIQQQQQQQPMQSRQDWPMRSSFPNMETNSNSLTVPGKDVNQQQSGGDNRNTATLDNEKKINDKYQLKQSSDDYDVDDTENEGGRAGGSNVPNTAGGNNDDGDEEDNNEEKLQPTELPAHKKKLRKHKKLKDNNNKLKHLHDDKIAGGGDDGDGHKHEKPVHEQMKNIRANLDMEFMDHDGAAERPGGAVLSLTLGVMITAVLAVLIGCRANVVRRRGRRSGGKGAYAHDADFLVNGMYL